MCAAVLGPRAGEPLASALALRFLNGPPAGPRGRAPALAATTRRPAAASARAGRRLPRHGGRAAPAIEDRLDEGVQTNEVGRSAVLAPATLVARRSGLPLRVLEVGASAGLNLQWDRYWYDTGETTFGDPDSPVRFEGAWQPVGERSPTSAGPSRSSGRPAATATPSTSAPRTGACACAPTCGPTRSTDWPGWRRPSPWPRRCRPRSGTDLGAWVEARLAEPVEGVATVVAHSIVWQYVDDPSQVRLRSALRRAGELATPARRSPGCGSSRPAPSATCASPGGRAGARRCWPPPSTTACRSTGAPPAAVGTASLTPTGAAGAAGPAERQKTMASMP